MKPVAYYSTKGLRASLFVLCGILTGCFVMTPLHEATRTQTVPHLPNKPLHVQSSNGRIVVTQANRADVQVVATLRCETPERLEAAMVSAIRAADGALVVQVDWPEGKRRSREGCHFEIQTPGANGLQLKSSNGSITVESLRGLAQLKTSNGSISVTNHAGAIDVETSNGKVKAIGIQGDAKLESSNGSIHADGVEGAIDAETSNGSIDVAFAKGSRGPVKARSSNGSIKIQTGDLQGRMKLKTSNGRIRLEGLSDSSIVEKGKKDAVLQFGNGGPESSAQTTNGSITVRP